MTEVILDNPTPDQAEWKQTRISGGWLTNKDTQMLFSNDLQYITAASEATIHVYSVSTGKMTGNLVGHNNRITGLNYNPFNPFQLYSSSLDGSIKLWDVMDGVLLTTWEIGFPVTKMTVDPIRQSVIYFFLKFKLDQRSKKVLDINTNITFTRWI